MNKKELIKAIIMRDNDTQESLETILEDMLPDFNDPLKPLPSVEDLAKEIENIPYNHVSEYKDIAKHILSKYGTRTREWWMDLKDGDKFINHAGNVVNYIVVGLFYNNHNASGFSDIRQCAPYTAPTAEEIIKKHNLTEEEIKIIKQS